MKCVLGVIVQVPPPLPQRKEQSSDFTDTVLLRGGGGVTKTFPLGNPLDLLLHKCVHMDSSRKCLLKGELLSKRIHLINIISMGNVQICACEARERYISLYPETCI